MSHKTDALYWYAPPIVLTVNVKFIANLLTNLVVWCDVTNRQLEADGGGASVG